jgi:hypothetical protein
MTKNTDCRHCPDCDHYLRLPGVFRRWEFEQVIQGSDDFHIKAAGAAEDGTDLFAVYCREQASDGAGGLR